MIRASSLNLAFQPLRYSEFYSAIVECPEDFLGGIQCRPRSHVPVALPNALIVALPDTLTGPWAVQVYTDFNNRSDVVDIRPRWVVQILLDIIVNSLVNEILVGKAKCGADQNIPVDSMPCQNINLLRQGQVLRKPKYLKDVTPSNIVSGSKYSTCTCSKPVDREVLGDDRAIRVRDSWHDAKAPQGSNSMPIQRRPFR